MLGGTFDPINAVCDLSNTIQYYLELILWDNWKLPGMNSMVTLITG